jgi:HEAT repeat protein
MYAARVILAALVFATALSALADEAVEDAPALTTAQLRALLDNKDPERIAFALYQLAARGELGDPAIKALCRHRDATVRRAAVFALGTTGNASAKRLLADAVRDADAGVRRAAVFGLGNLDANAAMPSLEAALADSHPVVRELAVTAVGRLGGDAAVRLLIKRLNDPSGRVRRAAVVVLGALRDPRALAPLQQLERDPQHGLDTKSAAWVRARLDEGFNFGYEFLTLTELMERFSARTSIPTFITDEALMAVALAAEDPDNLDSLKVSMWHVKARTLLDEVTRAAGLVWLVEGRWIVITVSGYLGYDTPLELELAGALYRLGDASAKRTLQRFANDPKWSDRAAALLKTD